MFWKSVKFGCHGYLFKWESMKCSLPWTDDIELLVLTFHFSFVSFYQNYYNSSDTFKYINWLPYQTSGSLNQALVFVRDGEKLCITNGHFGKRAIFYRPPCWKMVQSKKFHTMELFKGNLILVMKLGVFQRLFLLASRTDKMLTLNWSHSDAL